MKAVWPPIIDLTPGDMSDTSLIRRGMFPTHNHDDEPIKLTLAQQRRVQRWCRMIDAAGVGRIDSDPLLEAQVRRLVAVLKANDVVHLCELVQKKTGTDYPA